MPTTTTTPRTERRPTYDGRTYCRVYFSNILEHAGHVGPEELRRWAEQSQRIECYHNAAALLAAADFIEAGDLGR